MPDADDGRPPLGVAQHPVQRHLPRLVERRGRLVEKDDRRPQQQHPREGEPLLLATRQALRPVALVVETLDESNWAQRLSGGEQQRLAFARVLLLRPSIVFLDEATSALDEAGEMTLYRMLRDAEWRPTIVSVGHHSSLKRFHNEIVDLARDKVAEAAAK